MKFKTKVCQIFIHPKHFINIAYYHLLAVTNDDISEGDIELTTVDNTKIVKDKNMSNIYLSKTFY